MFKNTANDKTHSTMFTTSHKRNVLTNATKIEIITKMKDKLQWMLHRTMLRAKLPLYSAG
jgi:hypothetical protein